MKRIFTLTAFAALCFVLFPLVSSAQCSYYPVPVEERAAAASHIVLGRMVEKHPYWNREHSRIQTLTIMEVTAWLKGHRNVSRVGVITRGGVVGDRAMISYPSLSIKPFNEYVLFLQGDNRIEDNPAIRAQYPGLIQAEPYADAQGALTKQEGVFHDLLVMPKQSESQLLSKLKSLTGQAALTPQGLPFLPRLGDTYPLAEYSAANRMLPIASFSPTTTRAGTIVPGDFITILGSGFGAAPGTVFYRNADDGGATFISSGVASDNTAWADGSVTNKPASNAGTGTIRVNALNSAGTLTLQYSHIDINDNFSSFAAITRQRFYLRNINGSGGYTFRYNTTFNADAAATAAFGRAVATWRCATFVNFTAAGTTAIAAVANDGVNCVFYNAGLPAGVLGIANSFFAASATGGCNQANTVWWTSEIDVEFKTNPPAAGFTWNYGPGATGGAQFDFESVAVHELGHAHGLGHTIAPGTVMHFAISNGVSIRTPNANEIAGGNLKIGYSTTPTCFNPSGSGTQMIALNAGNCALPLRRISMNGEHRTNLGNFLEWSVDNEDAVRAYTLECQAEGAEFIPLHTTAATRKGTYAYQDARAGLLKQQNYRVKLVDQHGGVEYSDVLSLAGMPSESVAVFPTIAQDHIYLRGQALGVDEIKVTLYDIQGKAVLQTKLRVVEGEVDGKMDVQQLASGTFLYRIEGLGKQVTGKFVHRD